MCELAELNEEWDALGYNNRFDTFGVTGRLRSAEDEETEEIEHIIQANLGLRPAEIGLDGDYYYGGIHSGCIVADTYDVVAITASESETFQSIYHALYTYRKSTG